jgi:hypothetical protein
MLNIIFKSSNYIFVLALFFLLLVSCDNNIKSKEEIKNNFNEAPQNELPQVPQTTEAIQIGSKAYGGIVVSENNGELLIASESDLPSDRNDGMSWLDAKIKASSLTLNGYNDWRLPDDNELKQLCRLRVQLNLSGFYWSSMTYYEVNNRYNEQTQSRANIYMCGHYYAASYKDNNHFVRLVRIQKGQLTTGVNDNGIVYWVDRTGKKGLIVDVIDLGLMDWYAAVKAWQENGNGWYLPTLEDLEKLYKNEKKLSGLNLEGWYWCTKASGDDISQRQSCIFDLTTGEVNSDVAGFSEYNVRLVKAFGGYSSFVDNNQGDGNNSQKDSTKTNDANDDSNSAQTPENIN